MSSTFPVAPTLECDGLPTLSKAQHSGSNLHALQRNVAVDHEHVERGPYKKRKVRDSTTGGCVREERPASNFR